jgi:hypothetical protein
MPSAPLILTLEDAIVPVIVMIVMTMLVLLSFLTLLAKQYKRSSSNRVLVIYGKLEDAVRTQLQTVGLELISFRRQ